MNFFNFDIRKIITLAVLAALPTLSINLQKDSQDGPWVFKPFFFVSSLSQSLYSSFSGEVRNTTDLYLNLVDIKKNNRELTEQLSSLQTQLGDLTELKLENERLNTLLDFKQKSKMDLLAAKITGRDLFPNSDTLILNRGEEDGIKKGMAVITPIGAVGYISNVEADSSQVLLITHRYSVVDAIVQSSRARGIIHGYNSELCELKYLNRNDSVAPGDMIVTSGLDNIFPKGLAIGVVTEVKKDDFDFEQQVYLTPVISASKLEEVFIVMNAQHVQIEPAEVKAESSTDMPVEAADIKETVQE